MWVFVGFIFGFICLLVFLYHKTKSLEKQKECQDYLEKLVQVLQVIIKRRKNFRLTLSRLLPTIKKLNQSFRELLQVDDYFRHSDYLRWKEQAKETYSNLPPFENPIELNPNIRKLVVSFKNRFEDATQEIEERNDKFVEKRRKEYKDFFQDIEDNPLTVEQQEAVLHDEDRTLVIAGAGTGKTTTLISKVFYLLESGLAKSEEILLLAFNNSVAKELRDRIGDLAIQKNLEVKPQQFTYTFHSFGYSVIGQVEGAKPSVSKLAEDTDKGLRRFIRSEIKNIIEKGEFDLISDFLLYEFVPPKYQNTCETKEEYYEYIRARGPYTLRGERVRSFEEVLIANFLFASGVRYEYEKKYEYKVSTPQYRQYKPDFYLPDYGIYIEHFGIDKNGNPPPFYGSDDSRKYKEDMEWKRNKHKEFGTTLIETYSWEATEGILIKNLRTKLEKKGVEFQPRSEEELLEVFNKNNHFSNLVKLIARFLRLYKEGDYNLEGIRNTANENHVLKRSETFFKIFENIFNAYQTELRKKEEIDFQDMIKKASKYIYEGRIDTPYRYILVDEFQDISKSRAELLKAIFHQQPGCRLYCVGDDWQSIYRFNGADISIMTNFEKHFGFHKKVFLTKTFRFNDKIENFSSNFILQNNSQIKKELRGTKAHPDPAIYVLFNGKSSKKRYKYEDDPLFRATDLIAQVAENREVKLFVIGRYNFIENQNRKTLHELRKRYPNLTVESKTVHKCKGLEADYVIVDRLIRDKRGLGFPCEIEDDPLLDLVMSDPERFPNAEERRLFYVAVTRARKGVFLISHKEYDSEFIREIWKDNYDVEWIDKYPEEGLKECPKCETGVIEEKTGPYGPWKECSLCGYRPGSKKIPF